MSAGNVRQLSFSDYEYEYDRRKGYRPSRRGCQKRQKWDKICGHNCTKIFNVVEYVYSKHIPNNEELKTRAIGCIFENIL